MEPFFCPFHQPLLECVQEFLDQGKAQSKVNVLGVIMQG